MPNTENMETSLESQFQTVTIQSGDTLWKVLQSLNVHPHPDMQILWKRQNNVSKVSLTSDEWRYLPVGATLTIDEDKIIIENPDYKPEKKEQKQYKPVKPKISTEDLRQAEMEKNKADTILQTDLEQIEEEEKDIAITKMLFESQIRHENRKLRNMNMSDKTTSKLIKENQELFSVYGDQIAETLLLQRKLMGYPDLKERIDNFREAQGLNLYSNYSFRIDDLLATHEFFKSLEKEIDDYEKSEDQQIAEHLFEEAVDIVFETLFIRIAKDNERLWNKYLSEGQFKKLRADFILKLQEWFEKNEGKYDKISQKCKRLMHRTSEESIKNSYIENSFLYNSITGKVAKKKSPLLYKMYLAGVFDGGS